MSIEFPIALASTSLTVTSRSKLLVDQTQMQHDSKSTVQRVIKVSRAHASPPGSPNSNAVNEGDLPSQRQNPSPQCQDPSPQCQDISPPQQDPLPQHQDPSPQRQLLPAAPVPPDYLGTPEHVSLSTGTCSPVPPSRSNDTPSSSRGAPPPPKPMVLPPHPWQPAPLAPGVDPKAPRTANKVFDSVVAGMLTKAQHRFECLLFVEDAYPTIDVQIQWSIKCWETVCSGSQRYFELSKEMMSLVHTCCGPSTQVSGR